MARNQTNMARTVITSGFNSVTGSYLGNGLDGRIIDCGFSPDVLIIKGDTAQFAVFRISSFVGDKTGNLGSNVANFANAIQTFESKGFSLGSDTTVNSAGVMYYYHALKSSSGLDIKVGSYVGNGADNREITGIGFQPSFVFVKGDTTQYSAYRDSVDSGDISHLVGSSAADTTDQIQSLSSDGFQVGTAGAVNTNGITYYYFAISADSSLFKTGSFTGNGTDNRTITGVGFQPDVVWIKINSQITRFRTKDMQGDLSIGIMNGGSAANLIQSLTSDGFQVGDAASVNGNGATVHYIAWKNHRSRIEA